MRTNVLSSCAMVACAFVLRAQEREPEAGLVALHQALLDASTDAVVLNVAAHPDDESSRTNALLRRKYGMHVVTVYSTFGDGGQNAVGREIGPELAALRVRETLRASAMSGVQVLWLGMEDFGFSKTLEETRAKWGDENLLAAMRRVVDEVDPDFVLTNHSLTQGHGHHRASFWAISEVLKERATNQLWVPPLLARCNLEQAQWTVDPAEIEPARGETYARLAHRAWTQHVTQGPWGAHNPLQVGKDYWRVMNTDHLAAIASNGDAPPMPWRWTRNLVLAADERWTAGGLDIDRNQVARTAREALANWRKMSASNVELSARETRALPRRIRNLQRILLALANVRVEAWLERDEVAEGGQGKVNVVVHGAERLQDLKVKCAGNEAKPVQVAVRPTPFDGSNAPGGLPGSPSGTASGGSPDSAPGSAPAPRQPREVPGRVAAEFAAGEPTGGPVPRFVFAAAEFVLDGEHFSVTERLPYTPVPRVEIAWNREVLLVPKGRVVERLLSVSLKSHREYEFSVPVRLSMGPGVHATSIPGRMQLTREHDEARILVRAKITADELTNDAGLELGFRDDSARLPVRAVDVTVPDGMKVGLVRGPDDTTENTLADLGVPFTPLDRDALAIARLEDYTAILLDIRAYHHRPELAEVRDRILQYCRGGGRVVAMYHKPNEWNERAGHPLLAPFAMTIGDERITEEDCNVTFLQPQHALLQTPHTITAADFAGWVQERGLNFPKTWDPAWTPLLSLKDSGDEKPHLGALLHTQYGRGDFVFCSLALYRQLRVGNPGACRLLVNLLAK